MFFYRLGKIRDGSFDQQQYRASGLTFATAAIALRNTVYLERATNALHKNGHAFDPALRKHLSLLGWEHTNLTGDYQWRNAARLGKSKSRPLAASPVLNFVKCFMKAVHWSISRSSSVFFTCRSDGDNLS